MKNKIEELEKDYRINLTLQSNELYMETDDLWDFEISLKRLFNDFKLKAVKIEITRI